MQQSRSRVLGSFYAARLVSISVPRPNDLRISCGRSCPSPHKPAIGGVAFPDVTTQMELVTPTIWIMVLDCQVPSLAYFLSNAR